MIKLKTFKEILAMSKEKIDIALIPIRANKIKKQAELKIAELQEELANLELKIQEQCLSKDINFDTIINYQDNYSLTKRKVKQLEEIIKQLF